MVRRVEEGTGKDDVDAGNMADCIELRDDTWGVVI